MQENVIIAPKLVILPVHAHLKNHLLESFQIWVSKGTRPPSMVASDFETRFNVKSKTVEERFDFLFCRCA